MMQCAFLLILFPLSSCSLDAFLLGGGGRTADPLTSCASQNRCLPRLLEKRDGCILSDIRDRLMRNQASADEPMGGGGRARFPGSPAGRASPPATAESLPFTLRAAAAPATPGGSSSGAVPLTALLPEARRGHLPPQRGSPAARAPAVARLMPPGTERSGGPAVAGR